MKGLRDHALLLLLFTVVFVTIERINGSFHTSDLRVYYMAAQAWQTGDAVYGVPFGEDTGLFKYAPAVLLLFSPLAALPFPLAALLHTAVSLICAIGIAYLCERSVQRIAPTTRPAFGRALVVLLWTAVLFVRELHMGNINLLLVLLVLLTVDTWQRGAHLPAGMALGFAVLLKPYLGLLLLVPLLQAEWRLLRGAGAVFATALLAPTLLFGVEGSAGLHGAWVESMLGHSLLLESPNTISYLLHRWIGVPLVPLIFVVPPLAAALLISFVAYRSPKNRAPELLLFALALIPNLVVTDQQHFLYSLPLIALLVAVPWAAQPSWFRVLTAFAFFGYALRSSDLWGDALEDRWVWYGLLGSGNILLMGLTWYGVHRAGTTRSKSIAQQGKPEETQAV